MIKKYILIIILLIWPLYLNDLYLIPLQNSNLDLLWGLDIIFFFIIPSLTIFILIKLKYITLKEAGLIGPIETKTILFGLILCIILLYVVDQNIEPWLKYYMPWRLFKGYDFPPNEPLHTIAIFYAAITAGFLEEVVYRALVFSQLEKLIQSPSVSIFLSCLIFGFCHWGQGPYKIISTFIWSIPLAIWFFKKRKIWGMIVCHTLSDFFIYKGWLLY